MICPDCHAEIDDDADICPECHMFILDTDAEEAPQFRTIYGIAAILALIAMLILSLTCFG